MADLSTTSEVLKSLLKENERQSKEKHDGSVSRISKHHSKQKWEGDDGEQS